MKPVDCWIMLSLSIGSIVPFILGRSRIIKTESVASQEIQVALSRPDLIQKTKVLFELKNPCVSRDEGQQEGLEALCLEGGRCLQTRRLLTGCTFVSLVSDKATY